MARARHNHHGIADADLERVIAQHHQAGTRSDVINLLAALMHMRQRARPRRDNRFGKTLRAHAEARMRTGVHQLANGRAILGEVGGRITIGIFHFVQPVSLMPPIAGKKSVENLVASRFSARIRKV